MVLIDGGSGLELGLIQTVTLPFGLVVKLGLVRFSSRVR
jgi:hypothetical protein